MARPEGSTHASQDDLAAYAVDTTLIEADMAQHIATCPYCRAEVERYHDLEARLYRVECPDMEDLEAYALGTLSAARMATIERHRLDCPRCEGDLAVLRDVRAPIAGQIFAPPTPAAGAADVSVWERLQGSMRRIVAELLPAPPGVGLAVKSRGDLGIWGDKAGDERATEIYTAGAIEVALRRRRGPEGTILSGQITGAEDAIAARLVAAGTVDAHQGPLGAAASVPLETAIPPGGFFTLGPALAGSYTLEVLAGDELIVIADLQL
jgi:hypothetical protein